MNIPKIGETITPARAVELCCFYRYNDIAARIWNNPELFKDWEFDGASMVPDALVSAMCDIPNLIEIALKHDLKYAYGVPGDDESKLIADYEFGIELLKDGASAEVTGAAVSAVIVFGKIKSDFCWGFARK